ncbi:unnamed protein product [Coffea canephora]|uniref:Disease resistance RPP13-like protein 1 n=1 Tax=Coffea canephora TaxID=49390 RepID=A0A068V1Q9_COFCA|nr:unnamed protein product [Coffea canephora]
MAAALVGGSFLSAFLQVLFDRMARPEFLNLFRNQKADVALLDKLKGALHPIGAVLDDVENKEIRSQHVKKWLEELHDAFYQAEDLLDKINTEALRIKVETEYQSSTSNWTKRRRKQIAILGLQVVHSGIQSHQQFEKPLVDETTIFGRVVDKEKIIQMLLSKDADRDNITVIPIVGLGGLGKTTLARMIYKDSKVTKSFPTRAWVRSDKLDSLQVKLQGGLTKKKFLLVLDDVWNSNYIQWDELRIPFKGRSRGSKIIVTTWNQQVARTMAKERSIHYLDSMLEKDCRSLFKKHAFENRDGNEHAELEEIGNKIVKKCGGLPLAVKTVAGILRSRKTPKEWEDILASEEWTQMHIPGGPMPALRLSYIHLPSHLKRCFAFCAVFPKDYQIRKEEIIQLWQANDLLGYPGENKRIENEGEKCFHELRMRSLFHQSTDHTFSMHDLVNDLARFVFGKYCLRLEDHQKGNATISGARHFSYHPTWYDTFHKFNLLRENKNIRTFLQLRTDPMKRLSNRFLEDTLPQFMSLRFLSLSCYENIVKLPNSYSGFKQLRFLNLSATGIKELPDWICSFYNLQTLLLSNCRQLEELPKNLGKLINLCCLDISGTPLKKMPPQMGRLINLQVLTAFVIGKDSGSTIMELGKLPMLRGKLILSGLENVSAGMDASMANMEGKEHLENVSATKPFPSLKNLTIWWLPEWESWHIPEGEVFNGLERLSIIGCPKLIGQLPQQLPSLQSLEISGCDNLFPLHPNQLSRLEELTVDACGSLSPSHVSRPPASLKSLEYKGSCNLELEISGGEGGGTLEGLILENCDTVKVKAEWLASFPMLKHVQIDNCKSVEMLSVAAAPAPGIGNQSGMTTTTTTTTTTTPSLTRLIISNCKKFMPLPQRMESVLPSLRSLSVFNCPEIECFSEGGFPSTLQSLDIDNCKMLMSRRREWGLEKLTYLTHLTIRGPCDEVESFPEEDWRLPCTLQDLCLDSLQILKVLNYSALQHLTSVQTLNIYSCPRLQSLPEEGLPASLTELHIANCPLLKPRLEWKKGQDWTKVTHIHRLVVDGQPIP